MNDKYKGMRAGFATVTTLFFMWGFITVINGVLLPHLRSVFELDYTQTTLIESVWFIAYFFASIPSAKLIERVGYQRAIVIGLLVMAAGALGMTLAASLPSYGVTLPSFTATIRHDCLSKPLAPPCSELTLSLSDRRYVLPSSAKVPPPIRLA